MLPCYWLSVVVAGLYWEAPDYLSIFISHRSAGWRYTSLLAPIPLLALIILVACSTSYTMMLVVLVTNEGNGYGHCIPNDTGPSIRHCDYDSLSKSYDHYIFSRITSLIINVLSGDRVTDLSHRPSAVVDPGSSPLQNVDKILI